MYRLRASTNPIERNCSTLIERSFPNYEIFWNNFLEPLRGADGNWRNDTFQCLEEIGISQYGVIKSIYFIILTGNDITAGDPFQRFKNIYFHFGLIFDSVKNLARNICIISDQLGVISLQKILKKEKKDLISDYEKWIDNEYTDCYDKLVERGKPIFYYPQREHNFLTILLPKQLRRRYNNFVINIMKYRNFYIHTPGVDVTVDLKTSKLYAIKKEHIDLYRHWSTIRKSIPINSSHFDDPVKIIKSDLYDSLSLLNEVWSHFMIHMEKISRQDKYIKYLYNYDRG